MYALRSPAWRTNCSSFDKTQMLFGDAKAVIGEVVDGSTRPPAAAAVA
jgi:hypothetical protein